MSGRAMWWLGDPARAVELRDATAVDADPTTPAIPAGAVAFLLEVGRYARRARRLPPRPRRPDVGDFYKVYMSLWIARRGAAPRRAARSASRPTTSRARQGDPGTSCSRGRRPAGSSFDALRAAATTGPRQAELAFYGATLGLDPEAATPGGRRKLLEQVVAARIVLDAEYDLARLYLGRRRAMTAGAAMTAAMPSAPRARRAPPRRGLVPLARGVGRDGRGSSALPAGSRTARRASRCRRRRRSRCSSPAPRSRSIALAAADRRADRRGPARARRRSACARRSPILPLGPSLVVCDRVDAPDAPELVCWPDDSSYHLAGALPAGRRPRWLDLGCGSAFAPLARPELAAAITGVDLNPRAVRVRAARRRALGHRRTSRSSAGDVGTARGQAELVTCNAPIPDERDAAVWRRTDRGVLRRGCGPPTRACAGPRGRGRSSTRCARGDPRASCLASR